MRYLYNKQWKIIYKCNAFTEKCTKNIDSHINKTRPGDNTHSAFVVIKNMRGRYCPGIIPVRLAQTFIAGEWQSLELNSSFQTLKSKAFGLISLDPG